MVDKQCLNELALFAGAGGGILGGHLLGWRTVCAVEWEAYPASVLVARQNDGILPPFPIWDDVQTFDGRPWRGVVDVISGGFPCQDISAAGKGAGIDGERSGMWGEMARIIHEVRPRFVFVENSPMLTSRGLGRVLGDLASMGFDAKWGVLGAADVGANHQRDRIWIVANAQHSRHSNEISGEHGEKICLQEKDRQTWSRTRMSKRTGGMVEERAANKIYNERNMADTQMSNDEGSKNQNRYRERSQGESGRNCSVEGEIPNANSTQFKRDQRTQRSITERANIGSSGWWQSEPDVGRVVNGMASRVDRLKAIGNGQVPLCAATAWRILSERN